MQWPQHIGSRRSAHCFVRRIRHSHWPARLRHTRGSRARTDRGLPFLNGRRCRVCPASATRQLPQRAIRLGARRACNWRRRPSIASPRPLVYRLEALRPVLWDRVFGLRLWRSVWTGRGREVFRLAAQLWTTAASRPAFAACGQRSAAVAWQLCECGSPAYRRALILAATHLTARTGRNAVGK